jgi:hypothetical protein
VSSGYASMRTLWKGRRLRVSQLSPKNRRAHLRQDRTGIVTPASLRAAEEFRRRFTERTENRAFELLTTFQHANRLIPEAMGYFAPRLYDDGFVTGTMGGWDITNEIPRIGIPTLIWVGQFDHVTPANAREIHRAIPRSRLVVARGQGHLPFYEDRDRYISLVRGFLDQGWMRIHLQPASPPSSLRIYDSVPLRGGHIEELPPKSRQTDAAGCNGGCTHVTPRSAGCMDGYLRRPVRPRACRQMSLGKAGHSGRGVVPVGLPVPGGRASQLAQGR